MYSIIVTGEGDLGDKLPLASTEIPHTNESLIAIVQKFYYPNDQEVFFNQASAFLFDYFSEHPAQYESFKKEAGERRDLPRDVQLFLEVATR